LHVHQGRTDLFAQSDGLSSNSINSFFEDREGNVWVATSDGLDRFRDFPVLTISVKQGLSNASVGSVLAARDGSIWLGTRDGLNKWHDGQVTIYRKRSSGLPADMVGSLFQDDGGRIWVSTYRGFAFFENGRFIRVNAVPGGFMHAIAGVSSGNLWISHSMDGLFHLLGGRVRERIPWAKLGTDDHALALFPDPARGGLWLGFRGGGVAFFKDGQVRAFYSSADGLGEGAVFGFQADRDGGIWPQPRVG
jgi:ligand-binding sensor domain-containing protein